MNLSSQLRRVFNRTDQRKIKSRLNLWRLNLEPLEDRCLLSSSALAAAALLEGPSSGTDSDIVTISGAWSATSNATWLHTASSGAGNGLMSFTFDANAGLTRNGTISINNTPLLTVTQAGIGYVPANLPYSQPTIGSAASGQAGGVAVDANGNVYFSDIGAGNGNPLVKEWNAATRTTTTLISSGLSAPFGLAVDGSGNVYIANTGGNSIKEYNATTHALTTLVSGLAYPIGVAVDAAGNVYIADTNNNAIKEWNATTHSVTTLASIDDPISVAVDASSNVYYTADFAYTDEWNATTHQVGTLFGFGQYGLTVDASGNVYEGLGSQVEEWKAATQTFSVVVGGVNDAGGVAVDASGNVFVSDLGDGAVREVERAYVPGTMTVAGTAGIAALLPVLPTDESLSASSNQSWLSVGAITNSVVNFSFSANPGHAARTAQITVLGDPVTVTQGVGPTVLSIHRLAPAAEIANSASVTFAVTFSGAVSNVQAADFEVIETGTVLASPVVSVSGSGASYQVTVNGIHGDGTVGLNLLNNGSIKDALSNPLTDGFTGQAYNIEGQAFPYVASILRQSAANSSGQSALSYTVTFSKPVTGVVPADFQLATSGTLNAGALSVSGSGSVYMVTASIFSGTGTLGLNLVQSGTITDYAGNPLVAANPTPTFSNPQSYAAGSSGPALVVAPLTANGFDDIVEPNPGAGTVTVLLGNGNGTFLTPVTYSAGAGADSVAVGDVNGDGIPDIVVASNAGVGVLLGNGDGTFQAKLMLDGGPASVVALASLSGDGNVDVISSYSGNSYLSVNMGDGKGNFTGPQDYYSGGGNTSIAVADLSGNGIDDLVVNNLNNASVSVLLGNGNGTFQSPVSYSTDFNSFANNSSYPRSVAVADLNGDGVPDILVEDSGVAPNGVDANEPFVGVFLGNGNGTFQSQKNYFAPGDNNMAVADLDGSGILDVAVTYPMNGSVIGVDLGNGAGSFGFNGYIGGTGQGPDGIAVADLNGNGLPDIITANNNNVSVFMNSESGPFTGQLYQVTAPPPGLTTLTLSPLTAPITYPGTGSVTVTLASPYGTPTGSVILNIDGTAQLTQALVNGRTTFTLSGLTAGAHSLLAEYAAQNSFTASTAAETINSALASTTTQISAPSVGFGNSALVTVTVSAGLGAVAPTGNVSLTVNGTAFATAALNGSGTAIFPISNAITSQLGAAYSGDANDSASSSTATLSVTQVTTQTSISAPATAYGSNAAITVSVSGGNVSATGTVTLSVDGNPASSLTLADGNATFLVAGLSVGTHNLSASYATQGYFLTSSRTGTIAINSAPTTTVIVAPGVLVGNNASVQVTVTAGLGQATPSGSVSLFVNNGAATSESLVAGTATFTIPDPSAGSYSLSATYAANGNEAGSSAGGTLFVSTAGSGGGVSSGDLAIDGLDFHPLSGSFSQAGSVYTIATPVAIGFIPGAGQALVPLIETSGTTSINTGTQTFSSGAVTSPSGNVELLGSLSAASIATLTSASGLTGLTGNSFTLQGVVSFALSSLALIDTAGPQVQMQGTVSLDGLAVPVNNSAELKITPNSSSPFTLSSFTTTVSGSLHVEGISLGSEASANFTVAYSLPNNTFTITGSGATAGIGDIQNLTVQLPGSGLVIQNGALESFSLAITTAFTVGSDASFTASGLTFNYNTSSQQFSMAGNATLAIGTLADLDVTFGQGSIPGLVVTNGSLTSLNLTVSGEFELKGISLTLTDVNFTYTATGDQFAIDAGTASLTIEGSRSAGNLTVAFSSADTGIAPGLVIAGGQLQSLNVTVNGGFIASSVLIVVTNNILTYSNDTFAMTGDANVAVSGLGTFNVVFNTPNGLVISGGTLTELNMTTNDTLEIAGVGIEMHNLQFDYVNSGGGNTAFSMSGSADIKLKSGLTSHIDVTFGTSSNPGLVLDNGSLESLNMTVSASIPVGPVTIGASGLDFDYTAATNTTPATFEMSGAATVSMHHLADLDVTFGTPSNPGLIVEGGSLVSLNMEVVAGIAIPAIPLILPTQIFLAKVGDLDFTYSGATGTFNMSGTVGATIAGFGLELQIQGITVDSNGLEGLDMTVVGNIPTGLVEFECNGLNFDYTTTENSSGNITSTLFTMTGDATVQTTIPGLGSLSVDFGGKSGNTQTHGLVITDGTLTSMDMSVLGSLNVEGFNLVNTSLIVTYASNILTISGGANISVPYIASMGVNLGGNGTQGIVVNTSTGQLQTFNMAVTTSFGIDGLTFASADLIVTYNSSNGQCAITGGETINLPLIGGVTVGLGNNNTQGIVFTGSSFISANMSLALNVNVAGLDIFTNGGSYLTMGYQNGAFYITGYADIEVFDVFVFTAGFGGPGTQGIVIQNGTVTTFNMYVYGSFSFTGLSGSVGVTANYQSASQSFAFGGTATLTFGGGLPSWAQSFMPTASANFTFEILVTPSTSTSFFDVSTSIAGDTIGIQVFFNGTVDITMGDPFSAAFQEIAYVASQAYADTAQAFVTGYEKAANGLTNAYNVTATALNSAFQAASSAVSNVVSDIESFFSSWGNLSGATVYYDPNSNYDFAGDASATTGSDGSFQLSMPSNPAGQLIVVGGTDLSTGLANTGVITAPADAVVITPLTTLVNNVMQQTGEGELAANAGVGQAFGISSAIDLDTQEILKDALAGDSSSAFAFSVEVQISAIANEVVGLLSGAPGAPSDTTISIAFFNSLAAQIAQGAGTIDLTNSTEMQTLIDATATAANLTLDPKVVGGAATIMAGVNQYIQGLTVSGSASYLDSIVQAQVVADGAISSQLGQVAAGKMDIDTVVANNTGANLVAEIQAASAGSLDQDAPSLSVTQTITQPVGNGDPGYFTFTVYLTSANTLTQPVTVNYTTADLTALAANNDYSPVSGTLTWQPGDTGPQTITVPVSADSNLSADKQFEVILSGATNATIQSGISVGDIWYTDFGTTTTLTPSTTDANYGDQVTLTATVGVQDPSSDAGNGQVTFYNGTTSLGSATLVDGSATITLPTLDAGTYDLTAVYQTSEIPGITYDSSTSSLVSLTVNPLAQTINFDPLSDHTYGDQGFELDATDSSGLPVAYTVYGPASLSGDFLTITGAGSVTIQADQAGDNDFQSATTVYQSFNVSPATLTVVVDDQTMIYGQNTPNLTYDVTGFVNGDDAGVLDQPVQLSTVAANSNVGPDDIAASGADAANYTFLYVDGVLAITPAPLLITGGANSAVYGSTPTLTPTYEGFANGDTPASLSTMPTLASTGAAGSSVGTYDVSVSGAVDPNYVITYEDGTLNLTPAPLVVTANNATALYGQVIPTLSGSYSGFVNGDTAASLTAPASVGTSAEPGSNVGSYAISASGTIDPNYDISYVNGALSITPAPLTVTVNNASRVYGQANPEFTSSFAGLFPGDQVSVNVNYTTTATLTSVPAKYAIHAHATVNDPNYTAVFVSGTLTVAKDSTTITTLSSNPSVVGQSVTFTATVAANAPGAGTPTGSVSFRENGSVVATVPLNANGQATDTITFPGLAKYSIVAVYTGSQDFTTSTAPTVTQVVNKDTTTTTLSSSANPSVYGQSVTFTAQVMANAPGGGIPTGTVSFRENGVTLGVATLNASGQATFMTAGLAVKTNDIVVVYAGSSHYTTSTSAILAQTVTKDATSAILVSSKNPIATGTAVTFTVTVSALTPGSGTPTGNIDFYDGSTIIGTEALNAHGVATLTVSDLPLGNDKITGKYDGDVDFKTTRTGVFVERVNAELVEAVLASLGNSPLATKHLDQLFAGND